MTRIGIVYGDIVFDVQDVKGSRISDLRRAFPRSGAIKSVNDNSNRRFLQNVKVVLFLGRQIYLD